MPYETPPVRSVCTCFYLEESWVVSSPTKHPAKASTTHYDLRRADGQPFVLKTSLDWALFDALSEGRDPLAVPLPAGFVLKRVAGNAPKKGH
jgi:hypothetical protein